MIEGLGIKEVKNKGVRCLGLIHLVRLQHFPKKLTFLTL